MRAEAMGVSTSGHNGDRETMELCWSRSHASGHRTKCYINSLCAGGATDNFTGDQESSEAGNNILTTTRPKVALKGRLWRRTAHDLMPARNHKRSRMMTMLLGHDPEESRPCAKRQFPNRFFFCAVYPETPSLDH